MAPRKRQLSRSSRDREQYRNQGRGQQDYGRGGYAQEDRERYYEEGIGLRNLGHGEESQFHQRSGQFREDLGGGERGYGRSQHFDESIAGRPYPSTPFRGLTRRYQGSPSTFGTGGRFSNFGVGRNTPVGYSGYGSAEVGREFDFDRFDYDDRMSTGTFTGRGPKGYKRSDDRIREDVCEALTFDPFVDASEIEIIVSDGYVTLSGSVDDRTQKRRAEETAENISGVHDVNNQIRANRSDFGEPRRTGSQTGQQTRKEPKRAA